MEDPYPHICRYFLEGVLLGEISPEDIERVRLQAGETPLSDLLEILKASDREILRWYPPEQVTAEILRRFRAGTWMRSVLWARWLREPPKLRMRYPALVPILGVSLLVAMTLFPRPPEGGSETDFVEAESTRPKGEPGPIQLFRRTASGAEMLGPGQVVSEGDLVQLQLRVPGGCFATVLSLDGSGRVSRHWPVLGDSASVVSSGMGFLLPQSFQLDRAPGFEWFFLVTSQERFPIEDVLAEAERLGRNPRLAGRGRLRLGEGFEQSSFLLRKKG